MELRQAIILAIYIGVLAAPLFICFAVRKRTKSKIGFTLAVLFSAGLMSAVVLADWVGYDYYLEREIAPLDRDGNGFWTPDEEATWTIQDYKTLEAYIGDGGRNMFAAIIFPMFSVLYSVIVVSLFWLIAGTMRRRAPDV